MRQQIHNIIKITTSKVRTETTPEGHTYCVKTFEFESDNGEFTILTAFANNVNSLKFK